MNYGCSAIILTALVFGAHFCTASELQKVTISLKVIDDHGVPVTNAMVRGGFAQGGNYWIGERKSESIAGKTDTNGLFQAKGKTTGTIGLRVSKEGYYPWSQSLSFYRLGEERDGAWRPFDPQTEGVRAFLRRIGSPIPMYARRVECPIPAVGEPVGYDLEKGDWVVPYGQGRIHDIIFTMTHEYRAWEDFHIKVETSFSNDGDGIRPLSVEQFQGSAFRFHRSAPTGQYLTSWVSEVGNDPETGRKGMRPEKDRYYTFRVRTKLDENGHVKDARYGKLSEDIKITGYALEKPTLSFTYYLNPTPNDRNMEFDPKRNLFKNLKSTEEVTEP